MPPLAVIPESSRPSGIPPQQSSTALRSTDVHARAQEVANNLVEPNPKRLAEQLTISVCIVSRSGGSGNALLPPPCALYVVVSNSDPWEMHATGMPTSQDRGAGAT